MTTRKYQQRARSAAAEETRQRILDAMRDRLRAAPSEPLSVEKVAMDAGVARSTVYLIFGSKGGLFEALGRDMLERTGFGRIVAAVALPDARDALRESLRASAAVYAADRDVARAIYSMWSLEPEAVRGTVEVVERGRAEGQRRLAERLRDEGHLSPDVTVDEAADLLWVITSFDTFDQLYTGRALSEEDTAARLVSLASRSLFRAEHTPTTDDRAVRFGGRQEPHLVVADLGQRTPFNAGQPNPRAPEAPQADRDLPPSPTWQIAPGHARPGTKQGTMRAVGHLAAWYDRPAVERPPGESPCGRS